MKGEEEGARLPFGDTGTYLRKGAPIKHTKILSTRKKFETVPDWTEFFVHTMRLYRVEIIS